MEQLLAFGETINILFVIVMILIIWRGWRGMKKGLVDEAGSLIRLVVSLFVISVGILLYQSVKEKDTKNIVLSVIVILVTGLVTKLLHAVIKALSEVAHLPILRQINSILGIVVGAGEVIVALWIVYVIIGCFDTGSFGQLIMNWTIENPLLQRFYVLNSLAYWIAGL